MVMFEPLELESAAGHKLHSLQIHVRNHKLRQLSISDRTLEAYYGAFVFSQAWKGIKEAQRLALVVSYGPGGHDENIAGRAARVYELGPETPPNDIDGRSPAVVTWHDSEMFYLLASDKMSSTELVRVARSLYE